MKKAIQFLVFIIVLVSVQESQAQFNAHRYYQLIFQNVTETTNVLFSTNVPVPQPGGGFYETVTGYPVNVKEYAFNYQNLYMNIFQPQGDTITKRPVVIICFGGGFVAGSKDHWSMRLIAIDLAKRGYVAALIDYRLGMNLFDEDLSKRAVYRGIQDGRSAVRFFKADAAGSNIYKIDPEHIYIGGHSAGAFVALHNAYLDTETERPLSTYAWTQSCGFLGLSTCNCPDQLCLDCVGNNQSFSGHATAVFSLAGALGSAQYMESSGDPKMVMFHSTDDGTVPYTYGEPFQDISPYIVGSDLPVVYGSDSLASEGDLINLDYTFYSYTNRGHGVHEDEPNNALYSDIMPKISIFFYSELLKPVPHTLEGNLQICPANSTQVYSVTDSIAPYYQWIVEGGSFTTAPNVQDAHASVQWDVNAAIQKLTVVPYSRQWTRGDSITIQVNVSATATNTWQGTDTNWKKYQNWSLNALPQYCHDVVVPEEAVGDPILPTGTQCIVKSVTAYTNKFITLSTGSELIIQPFSQ